MSTLMLAKRSFRLPLLLSAAVLLAACSSPASRIDDKKSIYESYPPEVQQKLAAGQ
eukprot:gene46524-58013_t